MQLAKLTERGDDGEPERIAARKLTKHKQVVVEGRGEDGEPERVAARKAHRARR